MEPQYGSTTNHFLHSSIAVVWQVSVARRHAHCSSSPPSEVWESGTFPSTKVRKSHSDDRGACEVTVTEGVLVFRFILAPGTQFQVTKVLRKGSKVEIHMKELDQPRKVQ
eukprot:Skav234602  [mRNA]  locus=scaffold5214:282671:284965:- [translate_table: standard]